MQKNVRYAFAMLLLLGIGFQPALAQIKIGFADLEVILALTPEAQAVERELNTYANQLAQSVQTKEAYFNTKLEEFQEEAVTAQESGTPLPDERLAEMDAELQRLQKEFLKAQSDSEQKLMNRREQKLQPILDKIQQSIASLAEEKGYTYIFNTTSNGTSMVLHGAEQYNVTRDLLTRLGIEIPAEFED